jgi:hypothetical protein
MTTAAEFDSLIEGNYIHHTNSADVEQGDGIEIKEGSYGNTDPRQRHSRHELSRHHHLQHRRQRSAERSGRQRHLEQQRQHDPVRRGRDHP